jgi:hypothetical protein
MQYHVEGSNSVLKDRRDEKLHSLIVGVEKGRVVERKISAGVAIHVIRVRLGWE